MFEHYCPSTLDGAIWVLETENWIMREFLKQLQDELLADLKDNDHFTAEPIFFVEKRVRIYGLDPLWVDDYVWLDTEEGEEITDPEEIALYEKTDRHLGELPDCIVKTGYVDMWVPVQPFFTRSAAQFYVDTKSHKHKEELRIYVDSAKGRNPQWQKIRDYFMNHMEVEDG